MRSRKYIIFSWVMLLCAVFALAGCKKETGEENALTSINLGDIGAEDDTKEKDSEEKGAEDKDTKDNAIEDTLEDSEEFSKKKDPAAGSPDQGENDMIYVDVCGQVENPGVYQLTGESRVYEAIERAGGLTKAAAASSINQAERLIDGQQIYIPSEEEAEEARVNGSRPLSQDAEDKGTDDGSTKAGVNAGTADTGKVNLNTASKEELMSLTGVGEVKADSIIRYREEHGGFTSTEDIKKIEGIKDGVFNKIKDQITV